MQDQAIIIANADGVIELWSQGAVRLLGYSAREAVGQKLDLVVPPALRADHWTGFGGAMRRGTATGEGTFFDIPGLCRDGEVRTFRGQLHVLRNENKAAIGALAIFTRPA